MIPETDVFEERLLGELMQVVERGSVPAIRPELEPTGKAGKRFPVYAAGVAAAIIALGLIVAVGPTRRAYAVTAQGEGQVRVEIQHLSDADGLEQKLEEAGFPAEVDYLATGSYCKEPRFTAVSGDSREMVGFEGGDDGSLAFTLDQADFQGDQTLVIVTSGPPDGAPTDGSEVMVLIATGAVTPCEPVTSGDAGEHPREGVVEHP